MADLITLAYAKAYMRITNSDNDALINQIIDAVSSQVERHCDRKFTQATYREWLDGSGCNAMRVPQYPITRLYRVATNRDCIGSITYTGSAGVATAGFSSSDRMLTLATVSSSGVEAFSDIRTSGKTLTELSTSVGAQSGWSMTVQNSATNGKLPAPDIRPFSDWSDQSSDDIDIEVPSEAINARVQSWTEDTIETVDNSGFYSLGAGFPSGRSNVFVWYRAGYDTIPAGLQQTCANIVKQVYDSTTQDASVKSEKIGDYSYTLNDAVISEAVAANSGELATWCRKSL